METPRDVTPNQLQRMTTAVVGHPAYAAYGPSPTIALRGMPVVGHSMQATSYPGHSPHPSSLHTRADDLNTRYSQADGAVMAQQLHRTAPHLAPQALPSHRSHQVSIVMSYLHHSFPNLSNKYHSFRWEM